jgi:thymidylate synthase (FAD)
MIEVTYIDHMGNDLSVVNAARVSFGKKSKLECIDMVKGKFVLNNKDAKLIKYLAKHNHKSPFNHTFVTFHVKAPIFVARQLVKHEYMPWNEISRRYVDSEPEFYIPDEWRGRSEDKKQGSDGVINDIRPSVAQNMVEDCRQNYNYLLAKGVSPEQARMVLPQSTMTEWYWSGTLYAFAKMCQLRCAKDTQQESREVAMQVSEYMEKLFPASWNALWEHGT